ncbi:MAG: DUF4292 domain-containing protein [Chitinophagales bacterium]
MNKLLAAAAITFLFASCKTQSVVTKTSTAPAPPKSDVSTAIVDSLKAHPFQFEWLNAKAKVSVNNAGDETDFTANIRMRKDSAIWISISPALGIEVARMLMTRDSIRVIDRLNKQRFTRSYDFFKTYTSMPVDFFSVQNLITGNPIFLQDHYAVSSRDSVIVLTALQSTSGDSLVIARNFLPLYQMLTDSASSLSTSNSQYDIQYNPPFSLWRKIIIRHPAEMDIEITFSKIKLNEPVKFPFKD